MGTSNDANDEWIELYNDGATQDLSGWTLVALDGQPNISLSGAIGAGEYFLMERTDDSTLPNVAADLIYSGALGNEGETLELRDSGGVLIDTVSGSEGWNIGGDNTSKLTLQRSGTSWVTAEGTPNAGESNSTQGQSNEIQTSNTSSGGSSGGSSSKKASSTGVPQKKEPSLTIELGEDVFSIAGAPLTLRAQVHDENGPIERAVVTWNFGDGTTDTGYETKHTYKFSGEYVVKVRVTGTGKRDHLVAEDRVVARVKNMQVSITHADLYSIELTNSSTRDVDLSGYTLASGKRYFRIPEDTVLLAQATVRFPTSATELMVRDARGVGLFYPSGVLAVRGGTGATSTAKRPQVVGVQNVRNEHERTLTLGETVAEHEVSKVIEPTSKIFGASVPSTLEQAELTANVVGVPTADHLSRTWWYVAGLVALIAVAGAGVVLLRREEHDIALAYDIIDMDDDEQNDTPLEPRGTSTVRKH